MGESSGHWDGDARICGEQLKCSWAWKYHRFGPCSSNLRLGLSI